MICKICNKQANFVFSAKILYKYDIKYFCCSSCGFLQTEDPYWLDEAYNESINTSDTGIMSRNLNLSKVTTGIINIFFNNKSRFLDFAGGYGIFTRLMRDIGFDFYWNDKFSRNLVSRKFEYNKNDVYDLITSFESFEHFVNPIEEIESMLKISKSILFSTELYKNNPPSSDDWGYYGLNHGQHISFYKLETLSFIAKKYNLNLYSNGSTIHLITDKKLNNYLFNIIIKSNKFGVFNILKRLTTSKTMSDWKMLR